MINEQDKLEHDTIIAELSAKADLQCRQLIAQFRQKSRASASAVRATIGQLREEALHVKDAKTLAIRRKALDDMQAIQDTLHRDLDAVERDYAFAIDRLDADESERISRVDERLHNTVTHLTQQTAVYIQTMEKVDLSTARTALKEFPKTYHDAISDTAEGK